MQPVGEPSPKKPLVGYRMFGVPCAACALPMSVLWVFRDHLEAWHEGGSNRCQFTYQPSQDKQAELSIPDKKPDARKLPRKYRTCHQCGVKFMNPLTDVPRVEQTLCKSCRHQESLFSRDDFANDALSAASHAQ